MATAIMDHRRCPQELPLPLLPRLLLGCTRTGRPPVDRQWPVGIVQSGGVIFGLRSSSRYVRYTPCAERMLIFTATDDNLRYKVKLGSHLPMAHAASSSHVVEISVSSTKQQPTTSVGWAAAKKATRPYCLVCIYSSLALPLQATYRQYRKQYPTVRRTARQYVVKACDTLMQVHMAAPLPILLLLLKALYYR